LAWTPAANRPDRVLIWSGQLAANDFPPVCAMTGAPAEVWRKFRFATVPGWAYAFFALLCTGIGLIPVFIIMAVVSRRASGYLPLTRASQRRLRLVTWLSFGLLPLMIVFWIVGAVVSANLHDNTWSTIAGVLFFLGLFSFLGFIVCSLVLRPLVSPGANVMAQRPGELDRLVELRRVHPAFVAAINQLHQARVAQSALPPGST
jgi:hypothetical protein